MTRERLPGPTADANLESDSVAEARGWMQCPTRTAVRGEGGPPEAAEPAELEELDRMDWRHRALCREQDPELFFPIGTTGPAAQQVDEAKAVCRRCPVVDDCLTWSLETGQDAGVWGGTSEDERRALKRRGARARARTA